MHDRIRAEAYEANLRIVREGLVLLTWGNASVADREAGVFAIKPSGVDYDDLSPEAMVIVDIESEEVVEGEYRPSSDTSTHAEIYRAFSGVAAVVHTHSHYAVCYAQIPAGIPIYGTTHADHFRGPIPVTRDLRREEVEKEYELNTGKVIVETFKEGRYSESEVPGVLVSRHGPFAWGDSAKHAVDNAMVLEEVARMGVDMAALAPSAAAGAPTGEPSYLTEKHFTRKHGPNAYYGQKK